MKYIYLYFEFIIFIKFVRIGRMSVVVVELFVIFVSIVIINVSRRFMVYGGMLLNIFNCLLMNVDNLDFCEKKIFF